MAGRAYERPTGVRWNSAWPYTQQPEMMASKGDWEMAISISPSMGGLVVYYPMASQVADHFFHDRVNEAWSVGRAFEDLLRAAELAAYEKIKKAAA
ncbi:hypothetical protein ACFW2V_13710 [Streptomyces sp. NPDC058947]|uniref:hypothetical protein n=1 Tax=Streptomyces sp. NPDC058947 TaxID=3346675 RepID=UPI0036A1FC58